MTDHIPECPMNMKGSISRCLLCICDALSACEQRVAAETEAAMMESFRMKPSPPHDQHHFADNICAYCVGYSEALNAAREAVKGVNWFNDEGKMLSAIVATAESLVAIDALKERI